MDIPGTLTVREGRDRYLAANGFDVAGYTAPTFSIKILGVPCTFKNPPARQRAVPLHDLHHVATGYGTDFTGEAEIGIWELRGGCNTFFLWFINLLAVLAGVLISPLRVARAFFRARGQRSLYRDELPYEQLLELTVDQLRARLGLSEAP
jgi:hypothetical protein